VVSDRGPCSVSRFRDASVTSRHGAFFHESCAAKPERKAEEKEGTCRVLESDVSVVTL